MPASLKLLTNKRINYYSLLARWKDDLYYTAALVDCDKANKKCLVCFEDGSEIWANNRDLHIQLTLDQLNEDEDIVCCICDGGESPDNNFIILCDVCNQGYHQKCHKPPVDSTIVNENKDWICATCSYILNQKDRAKLSAAAHQQQQLPQQTKPTGTSPQPPQQPKSKQPTTQKSATSQTTSKQPAKVKQTPTSEQQQNQKSTIGPVKPTTVNNHQPKQAPYYPLSSQVRAMATSSTAALASMTASSALVVGSSAGRTKQDLVNQSNRSSQRQRQTVESAAEITPAPPKHAVRKSSVNFVVPVPVLPVRQSALPTATRSPLPGSTVTVNPATVSPNLIANTTTTVALAAPAIATTNNNNSSSNDNNHNISRPQTVVASPPVRINPINNQSVDGKRTSVVTVSQQTPPTNTRVDPQAPGSTTDITTNISTLSKHIVDVKPASVQSVDEQPAKKMTSTASPTLSVDQKQGVRPSNQAIATTTVIVSANRSNVCNQDSS